MFSKRECRPDQNFQHFVKNSLAMPKSYQTILNASCQKIGFLYFLQAVQVKWRMSAKVKFFQLGAARWKYPENTLAGESIYMGHSSRQGWRVGSIKIFHAIFSIGHLSLSSKHRAWLHQIDDAIFLYLPKEPPLSPLTPFPPGLTQHLHLRWGEEIFQRMYSRTWEMRVSSIFCASTLRPIRVWGNCGQN